MTISELKYLECLENVKYNVSTPGAKKDGRSLYMRLGPGSNSSQFDLVHTLLLLKALETSSC